MQLKKKKNLKYRDTFSKLHYFLHKHPLMSYPFANIMKYYFIPGTYNILKFFPFSF